MIPKIKPGSCKLKHRGQNRKRQRHQRICTCNFCMQQWIMSVYVSGSNFLLHFSIYIFPNRFFFLLYILRPLIYGNFLVAFFIYLNINDLLFAFFLLLFPRFNQRILSLLTSLCSNVASSNPVQGRVQRANTHLHKRLWLMWRMVFEGLCGRIGKWHSKSSS